MAAEPIGAVLGRLADRARDDEALAETLVFLAEDDVDPFARPSDAVLTAARTVNAVVPTRVAGPWATMRCRPRRSSS